MQDIKPKSLNTLMRHLRNKCNIDINGSTEKKQLLLYGYYHGYKGYRFYKKSRNLIPFKKFSEIITVAQLDTDLKSLFYPHLMFIETALKNIVINNIIEGLDSATFDEIYRVRMNKFENPKATRKNIKLQQRRLETRNTIYKITSGNYRKNNPIASHFYNNGQELPIWAIFESVTLGDFGNFVSCLNKEERIKILQYLNMYNKTVDTECNLLDNVILTLRPLRNAVAHNNVVFDARFNDRAANNNVIHWLELETGLKTINFENITDFFVLIVCMLKKLDVQKTTINRCISNYTKIIENFKENSSQSIINCIIDKDTDSKINAINL